MLRTTLASVLTAAAIGVVSSGSGSVAFGADPRAPEVGEHATDFELSVLGAEEKVSLKDYRGESVV